MLRTKAWFDRGELALFYRRYCGGEGVKTLMAGNQSDARRRAQQDYESAARNGAEKSILDHLYATVLDKQAAK